MDEYVITNTGEILNGRIVMSRTYYVHQIPPGIELTFQVTSETRYATISETDKKFWNACLDNIEFFNYYFRSSRVVAEDSLDALRYFIDILEDVRAPKLFCDWFEVSGFYAISIWVCAFDLYAKLPNNAAAICKYNIFITKTTNNLICENYEIRIADIEKKLENYGFKAVGTSFTLKLFSYLSDKNIIRDTITYY